MSLTTIILITHQSPEEVAVMCGTWQVLEPSARIHIAYGGDKAQFAKLNWPNRSFIDDPRLRTRDHQRERQSYRGLMQTIQLDLTGTGTDRILMVEFDVIPLRSGLVDYLAGRQQEERADVLGARLRRVDGTSHPHFLAHQHHEGFKRWTGMSIRENKEVVMMMLGCLSWWTWEAFSGVAEAPEAMPVYLELALATTPHLLGFRVRNLPEFYDDMEPVGELEGELEARMAGGRWVVHPCKNYWKAAVSRSSGNLL
jgi:hypothetical protein